jgi:hypothetical protein
MMSQSQYRKRDLLVRKERLQLEKCSCSGEGWGFYGRFNSGLGVFVSLAVDSWAFSSELVCLSLIGEGKQS